MKIASIFHQNHASMKTIIHEIHLKFDVAMCMKIVYGGIYGSMIASYYKSYMHSGPQILFVYVCLIVAVCVC